MQQQPIPDWIASANEPLGPLPLFELLDKSVYYPSCGLDGQPVKFLGGYFHSFVYVDYGVRRDDLLELLGEGGRDRKQRAFRDAIEARQHLPFRGYRLVACRNVEKDELTPHGWFPHLLEPCDGNPPDRSPSGIPPFAVWSILERTESFDDTHGPARFSLLYVGGDGVASFNAMYLRNNVAPAVVAVIQPGTGFGGNYTDFEDPNQSFARLVRENPVGPPQFLLFGGRGDGGFYAGPCWPDYVNQVCRFTDRLRLWQRIEQ